MYVFKTLTHVSFICTVYIRNENIHVTGNFCADIDECAAHNGWCTEHSTCNNTPGSYECVCDSGYKALGSKCVGQSVLLLIYTPSFALLSQFLHYGIVCGVNGRVSARLSVCLSHHSTAAAACGGFAAERRCTGHMNRRRRAPSSNGAAARRSAAYAGSAVFTAEFTRLITDLLFLCCYIARFRFSCSL